MNRRFRLTKRPRLLQGAPLRKVDPAIRHQIVALERLHKRVQQPNRKLARRRLRELFGNGLMAIAGLVMIASLTFFFVPSYLPLSIVAIFSPEEAALWREKREIGCMKDYADRWLLGEVFGQSSSWRWEHFRACVAERRRADL